MIIIIITIQYNNSIAHLLHITLYNLLTGKVTNAILDNRNSSTNNKLYDNFFTRVFKCKDDL